MKKPEFKSYVCNGDTISWTQDGFDIVARIEQDDCRDRPDERQDGFWPSLNPKDAGFIGFAKDGKRKSKATLQRHHKRAQEIMEAWEKDEWWYVGVCVTVSIVDPNPPYIDDIELVGKYDHACWGIEANYPVQGKHNPNAYLAVVARELADEALIDAKAKLDKLKEKVA